MSTDIFLLSPSNHKLVLWQGSMTSECRKMAHSFDIYEPLYLPIAFEFYTAEQVEKAIKAKLKGQIPPEGDLRDFLCDYLEACRDFPKALVQII